MRYLLLVAICLVGMSQGSILSDDKTTSDELTLVVMDPLAADLSCPCVKGYAQRDYAKLGEFLGKQLKRPVKVHFAENLTVALTRKTAGKLDILIGKDSVVNAGAKANKIELAPIAALTGKDGKTTQSGLWIVADKDPAVTVADIAEHELYFGPADAAEKYDAPKALLKEFDIKIPAKTSTCNSCTEAALKVIELNKAGRKAASVISSYAQPLLEGCGTVKKGEVRVIGETEPVKFITVSLNAKFSAKDREAIQKAFLSVAKDETLCKAMETKKGFVIDEEDKAKKK